MKRSCKACGASFIAQRSTAKYCSDACRQRGHRGAPAVAAPEPPKETSDLVDAVRTRVSDAGLDGSVDGHLAVRLAEAVVSNEDGTKLAALVRQLFVQMDRIEALSPRVTTIDDLRRRRDRKRGIIG